MKLEAKARLTANPVRIRKVYLGYTDTNRNKKRLCVSSEHGVTLVGVKDWSERSGIMFGLCTPMFNSGLNGYAAQERALEAAVKKALMSSPEATFPQEVLKAAIRVSKLPASMWTLLESKSNGV